MEYKYSYERKGDAMDNQVGVLKLEATRNTPYVFFDPNKAVLEMKGRSSPQDSIAFYDKIFKLLDNMSPEAVSTFDVNLALEYFNTSSAKCIFDLFRRLEKDKKTAEKVVINWFYEADDDDMYEVGEDYGSLTQLNFNILPLQ